MTLAELVQKHGSQQKAAKYIGCHFQSLCGWLSGRHSPRGLNRKRLIELGVKFDSPA